MATETIKTTDSEQKINIVANKWEVDGQRRVDFYEGVKLLATWNCIRQAWDLRVQEDNFQMREAKREALRKTFAAQMELPAPTDLYYE